MATKAACAAWAQRQKVEVMRRAGVAVYVHIVWSTWDRLPLLSGEIERRVHRAIAAKCTELGSELVALGGVEDHVHLLIGLPPTISLAQFVGAVKGSTSHLVTHEIVSDHTFFKWQGAYGAVSVSPSALADVSQYIAHQREHHAANNLISDWEHLPDVQPAQAGFADERERVP